MRLNPAERPAHGGLVASPARRPAAVRAPVAHCPPIHPLQPRM